MVPGSLETGRASASSTVEEDNRRHIAIDQVGFGTLLQALQVVIVGTVTAVAEV